MVDSLDIRASPSSARKMVEESSTYCIRKNMLLKMPSFCLDIQLRRVERNCRAQTYSKSALILVVIRKDAVAANQVLRTMVKLL